MTRLPRFLAALIGCMSVMLGAPAQADDAEVFTNSSFLATGVRPNVLFILDTSGSMKDTKVSVFDGTATYTGDCPTGRIYWQTANDKTPPDCSSKQWISVNNNRCAKAAAGFAKNGWWRGKTLMLLQKDSSDKALNPTKWGS